MKTTLLLVPALLVIARAPAQRPYRLLHSAMVSSPPSFDRDEYRAVVRRSCDGTRFQHLFS